MISILIYLFSSDIMVMGGEIYIYKNIIDDNVKNEDIFLSKCKRLKTFFFI